MLLNGAAGRFCCSLCETVDSTLLLRERRKLPRRSESESEPELEPEPEPEPESAA